MPVKLLDGLSLRSILFGVGAIGAVATATDIALKQGLSVLELIAVGCTALAAFAAKWPTDVTAKDAREIEARVKRESVFPPPGARGVGLADLQCYCKPPYRGSVTDQGLCAFCGKSPPGDES